MDEFTREALARAEAFIRARPGYAPHEEPLPPQGVTNRVVRARLEGEPVVLKLFRRLERWQRELYGLRHFATTGLVPRVLDASQENLIVSRSCLMTIFRGPLRGARRTAWTWPTPAARSAGRRHV